MADTNTGYQIRRRKPIIQFSLKLEKLGYIKILEKGYIKLPIQFLVSEKELENLGILKVFQRENLNLSTPEKDLNALLNNLPDREADARNDKHLRR